tara:strand:+ start:1552 stop:2052 length:501 start_codon:yes stop_codon:yes gene_type:complete
MSKGFTHENFNDFKKIEGFDGPYRNLYLKGIALGKGPKEFEKLEEAVKAANENSMCGGITVNRKGKYSLRRKSNLLNSDTKNRFKSIEITYVKNENYKKEIENIVIQTEPFVIEEYLNKDKKLKNYDELYEIIIYNKKNYYFNSITKNVLNMKGYQVGKLTRGIIE